MVSWLVFVVSGVCATAVPAVTVPANDGDAPGVSPGGAAVNSQGRQPLEEAGRQLGGTIDQSGGPDFSPVYGAEERAAGRIGTGQKMRTSIDPQPVQPPVVGQPTDFSGAVGDLFTVE